MDAMVSARIPTEMRNQVNAVLKGMGATPTQLINAAYEYVLATGKLPVPETAEDKRRRQLSDDQRADLLESFRLTTCKVPASYFEGRTDDELLEAAMLERYGLAGESK